MMMRSAIVACFVLLVAPGVAAGQSASGTPLRVADVLDISTFGDRVQLALSADGGWIAVTLQHPKRAAEARDGGYFSERGVPREHAGSDVYVIEARTGRARRLSDGTGSAWGPAWSPDGRRLAFYSDRDGTARLWLWDRRSDAMQPLVGDRVRAYWGFDSPHWSRDGRALLVKLYPEGMDDSTLVRLYPSPRSTREVPTETGRVTARVLTHDPAAVAGTANAAPTPPIDLDSVPSFLNVQLSDLAVIEVESRTVRRVARRMRVMGYRFAPDGRRVAFTTRQPDGGRGMLVYDRYDLFLAGSTGGDVRMLAPRTIGEYGLGFSWSPDGERVAFMHAGGVTIVHAGTGDTVHRFQREGVALTHEYRPPIWNGDRSLILVASDTLWRLTLAGGAVEPVASPRDRRLLDIVAPAHAEHVAGNRLVVAVLDRATKRAGFQSVNLATGAMTPLFEDDIAIGATDLAYHLATSGDSRTVAFVAESGARPPDVWLAQRDFSSVRRISDLQPQVTRLPAGRSRLIEWTDVQGRRLQGALLLPAGYVEGQRYPLVVKVYGGSLLSGRVHRYGLQDGIDNLQLLATRGYAVLLPDAPTRVGTPMQDVAAAVISGAEAVVAMGVADSSRMAVFGHSYGGYSALAAAVTSQRFRAVVSSGGFSNLFSQYTEMREDGSVVGIGWTERGQGRIGGHPWEHFDRFRDNSPFFFMDRVNAPVLLLHGGADRTVLPQRAEETFVALRRLGKPVTLVVYDGEGHHPGSWQAVNATDYWERIFAWLERHMGPIAKP